MEESADRPASWWQRLLAVLARWEARARAFVMARVNVDGEEEPSGLSPSRPHPHRRRQSAPEPWPEENADPERALAPSSFEQRFTRLQRDGDFGGMWDLLAQDAQREWGGRERFVDALAREGALGWTVLDVRVLAVQVLSQWHDQRGGHDYQGVARLRCRYRLRHQEGEAEDAAMREVELDREVHLVPEDRGWRTLYYPPA
ncbi:MAG: hypothetical protein J2P39_14490 [Candidatus Dormibacteraeota bacterium]|nr:hypothetical protein [Candidatus Dormibacteraeota bacterium]